MSASTSQPASCTRSRFAVAAHAPADAEWKLMTAKSLRTVAAELRFGAGATELVAAVHQQARLRRGVVHNDLPRAAGGKSNYGNAAGDDSGHAVPSSIRHRTVGEGEPLL